MRVRTSDLNRRLEQFLRGPEWDEFLKDVLFPWWLFVVILVLSVVAGLCTLVTIVVPFVLAKLVYSAFRQARMSNRLIRSLRSEKQNLRPLILTGIIANSALGSEVNRAPALMLGSFQPRTQEDLDWLVDKSQQIASLYIEGPSSPADEPFYRLLRDDVYVPHRRRRVGEPVAEGRELYMFDVMLKTKLCPDKDTLRHVLAAFVATPGDEGPIQQIDWSIVSDAVDA